MKFFTHLIFRISILLLANLGLMEAGLAQNPAPAQIYYLPFPEDQQLTAFDAISVDAVNPLNLFVSIAASSDATVIYYDQWEDGYEVDISNPQQSTTQIWGDGNPANGAPPGNPADVIMAGTRLVLRNYVDSTTRQAVIDFDGGDKIAASKSIAVNHTIYAEGSGTLLAGAVEVMDTTIWGLEYRSPVGQNILDGQLFEYSALSIMARTAGTQVQIDADNNGTFETTVTLNEGQSHFVNGGVMMGARVLADKPVQVLLFTGDVGSSYASRDTILLPVARWASDYLAPVSTRAADGTVIWLYNPSTSAITVTYDRRATASTYTSATISVAAGSYARVDLLETFAYRFYTTGDKFYAFSTTDAQSLTNTDNSAYDAGYALLPRDWLTTQILVGFGIGRDLFSTVNPTENGNPIWVTTAGSGHTVVRVYVDYNGDRSGALTDPNGNGYDAHYDVRELDQLKLLDPDGDQSGMVVYVLNQNVRVAAAWNQDPALATAAAPGLDVATGVPPLVNVDGGKIASVAVDVDGDGQSSPGDRLNYDIFVNNASRGPITGPFVITDALPADVIYVAGTTRYRIGMTGVWGPWTDVPDSASGTLFPLDAGGLSIATTLAVSRQIQISFLADLVPFASLTPGISKVVNTGTIDVPAYVLTIPLSWATVLHGSIGDRVWLDTNGNGVQDSGETGINGVIVYADLNNNGVKDVGEPTSTTSGNGNYLLSGAALVAGTYVVRVDQATIVALNPGYGPTFDLDGLTSFHQASVVLLGGEDRTNVDFGYRVGGSVGDRIWLDRDADGVQEAGEPGFNGVRVYLDLNNDSLFTAGEPYSITFGDGNWDIGNLAPGTYNVRVDTTTVPAGLTPTFDKNGTATPNTAPVTVVAAEGHADLDFGYRGVQSIGDLVWNDINGNGVFDSYSIIAGQIDMNGSGGISRRDDGFINGVQIIDGQVDISGNGTIGSEDDGTFLAMTVINGDLDVSGNGSIGAEDVGTIALDLGLPNVRVFVDINNNGLFDATEPAAVTNASGAYTIGNMPNGTWSVRVDTSSLPLSQAGTFDLDGIATPHVSTVVLSGANRTDVDFGYRDDASLGNRVWNDLNNNGVQDVGEPGLVGVLVYIDSGVNNNIYDPGEPSAITDANGNYTISQLSAATHEVRIEYTTLPPGAVASYDLDGVATLHVANVSLTTAQDRTDADFGYHGTSSIGDRLWTDTDGDGVQDVGELPLNGVVVYLDINGDDVRQTTEPSSTTAGDGNFLFSGLVAGNYSVRVDGSTLPVGMVATFDLNGPADGQASIALTSGQSRLDLDFGYAAPTSLGDRVWLDLNGNGTQDLTDLPLSGVSVYIDLNNSGTWSTDEPTATTATDGSYSIGGLVPGTYRVVVNPTTLPAGVSPTYDLDGVGTAHRASVALIAGQVRTDVDFGYQGSASLSGIIYIDTNGNGTKDSLEAVLPTVIVFIDRNGDGTRQSNEPFATTTAAGAYSISGLIAGTYAVVVDTTTIPSGVVVTGDPDSTKDGKTSVILTSNEANTTTSFGYQGTAVVSGRFVSGDGNGTAEVGETGFNSITITLTYAGADGTFGNSDDRATTVATDTNGAYSFSHLIGGNYRLSKTTPAGYYSLADVDGGNADQISLTLAYGATLTGRDFEAAAVTISGRVWDDANNSANNTFTNIYTAGETGTNAGGLFAILIDGSGNVVQNSTVTAAGLYSFSVVPPAANYTIRLSTTAGSIGLAAPAAALPTGWTATSPTTTSTFSVATTSIANADFGIEQLPTAYNVSSLSVNPGGTTKVTVPTLNGTDPEDPSITSFRIQTLPTNGTLYYDGNPVSAGDTITSYNPALLTIDPNDGTITVSFTYQAKDAAGKLSNTASVTMDFTALNLAGHVFDDANGLTDSTINGTLTDAGNTLYANLVSGGLVVKTTAVDDGNYSFSNVSANTNYIIVLSTTNGTIGAAAPAASLPGGYVTIGETIGTGAGNDLTPNGQLSVAIVTTSVSQANFGIEQLPTADPITAAAQINPGGTTTLTVPTLTASDPEDAAITTFIITTLPTNGTLYYDGNPVSAGDTITSYNPALLTVDPNDGTITVSFTYQAKDAAGKESPTAMVEMPFTALNISGTVFNDLNRLTDGLVNGTGTNVAGAVFANLVNPVTHVIVARVGVSATGTYSFGPADGVTINTDYELILTKTLQTVGASLSVATLPAAWISTGEHLGVGVGNDSAIDGKLLIATTGTGVEEANFGIVQVPDITPVITAVPNVMHAIQPFYITVRVTELNVVNTDGLITVRIPKDIRWVFNGAYNPALTVLGSTTLNNADWSYSENTTHHIFTSNTVIPAGGFSYFGFRAIWNAGQTRGIYTITSQIDSGSGSEDRIDNNVDAEKLDYFIQ